MEKKLSVQTCPICQTEIKEDCRYAASGDDSESLDDIYFKCRRCGNYRIAGLEEAHLPPDSTAITRAALSHAVRLLANGNKNPKISKELIERIIDSPRLPTPDEQAEYLLLLLGDKLEAPGESFDLDSPEYEAVIGAVNAEGLRFIRDALTKEDLLKPADLSDSPESVTLTFSGWRRYGELKRGRSESKKVFMAMPFGNHEISMVYENCFKVAVVKTGFHLERLDEAPKAGSIDDRLRVEIRTSRFMIAELTGSNLGVYWEAGFAEGLGKPVIYTCRKEYFKKKGTHFDINHLHTVCWEPDDLQQAEHQLKNTIRATLPDEAVMEDS